MRLFLLAALLSSTALADDYVILAGFDARDPYQVAAKALSKHHGGARILRFDPEDPDQALPELRRLAPRFVAFVLRPDQIHVNSVRRLLVLASRVDDDPFVDFEFGYVTGATALEAEAFVANIVKASAAPRPRRVGYGAVWGVDACSAADEEETLGELTFPKRRLAFAGDTKERDQAFLDRELRTLAGCGAIELGGHGMPWEIGHGPQAEDVAKLDLFPAVVLNYACHTGVTTTWLDESYEGDGFVSRFKPLDPSRSFALTVLRSGATGYVAYVNPRPAGPEMSVDWDRVLCGATLGESRRRDYDKVVLGYIGFGEKGLTPPVVKDGSKKAGKDLNVVRDLMLDAATGGILYGDPSTRVFPAAAAQLPQKTTRTADAACVRVVIRVDAAHAWTWCSDPFRQAGNVMAGKVVERVELPDALAEPLDIRVLSATWGRTDLKTLPPVFAVEHDGGKRYLQVKVNWSNAATESGDVAVEIEIKAAARTK